MSHLVDTMKVRELGYEIMSEEVRNSKFDSFVYPFKVLKEPNGLLLAIDVKVIREFLQFCSLSAYISTDMYTVFRSFREVMSSG